MVDVLEYARCCGPGAFSAITGASRNDAAKALISWTRRAGHSPAISTSPSVLAAALIMRGYRLEKWSTTIGNWRIETEDEFVRRIWRSIRTEATDLEELVDAVAEYRAHRQKHPAAVKRALKQAAAIRIERSRSRQLRGYTFREWLQKRPIGTWILFVKGHGLVARRGIVIAGDTADAQEYGDENLIDAWRVLPRRVFQ